jgi:DNA-binding FadR family transcriptional regulator
VEGIPAVTHSNVGQPTRPLREVAGPGSRRAEQRAGRRSSRHQAAICTSATHATAEEREQLAELAGRLREMGEQGLGQTEEYLMTDVEFHQTLLRASGNEMLAALDQVVKAVMVGRTRLGLSPATPVAEVLDHHVTTARAIRERMPEAAEVYSRLLVARVRAEFVLPE